MAVWYLKTSSLIFLDYRVVRPPLTGLHPNEFCYYFLDIKACLRKLCKIQEIRANGATQSGRRIPCRHDGSDGGHLRREQNGRGPPPGMSTPCFSRGRRPARARTSPPNSRPTRWSSSPPPYAVPGGSPLNSSSTIRPSRRKSTRSKYRRCQSSCETITTVWASSRFSARIRSRIRTEFLESRFAQGSSASSSAGRFTSARAIATRCCSPPESSPGRNPARSFRPTWSRISRQVRLHSFAVIPRTLDGR